LAKAILANRPGRTRGTKDIIADLGMPGTKPSAARVASRRHPGVQDSASDPELLGTIVTQLDAAPALAA